MQTIVANLDYANQNELTREYTYAKNDEADELLNFVFA